jgi:hypothetical protein
VPDRLVTKYLSRRQKITFYLINGQMGAGCFFSA